MPRRGQKGWSGKRGEGKAAAWLKAHVSYQGDDCLPWPFFRDSRVGRGHVSHLGKQWWAHRLMCVWAHGNPPTPQHQASHECGNGHLGCVNPRHLKWKTNGENQLDRRRHGTTRGSGAPVLSNSQVAELHRLAPTMTQVRLAAHFGVSLGCVQYWLKVRARRGHDLGKIKFFSAEEDAYMLQAKASGQHNAEIAKHLGRTESGVRARLGRLQTRERATA